MNLLVKNLIAGMVVGSLTLAGAVIAQGNEKALHKFVEVKAKKDENVVIKVDNDGNTESVIFTADELSNDDLIDAKLAHLDEDTKETVLQALNSVKQVVSEGFDVDDLASGMERKVVVMHKGDGALVNVTGDVDYDFDVVHEDGHKSIRKHIIIGDETKVLKGHTDAIVKLIERGEFSYEELDKIQVALDAKR